MSEENEDLLVEGLPGPNGGGLDPTAVADLIADGTNSTLQAMQNSLADAGISPTLGLLVMSHMSTMLYEYVLDTEKLRVFQIAQDNPNISEEQKTKEKCFEGVDKLHAAIRTYLTRAYLPLKEGELDPAAVVMPSDGEIH